MLHRKPNIVRSLAWNYLGYAWDSIAGILLVAYTVRRVPIVEYGLLLFALSVSNLFYLLSWTFSNLLVAAYVEARESGNNQLTKLLSTTFVIFTGLGSVAALLLVGIALALPGPFNIPHEYVREMATIMVLSALGVQGGLPAAAFEHLYQAFHRFDRLNQLQLITATVRVVLTVVVLAAGHGVLALAAIQVGMMYLRLALLWLMLPASIPGVKLSVVQLDWCVIKPLIRPGGWATLETVSRELATISDSAILASLGSMSSVAVFSLGTKFPAQLSNLVMRGGSVILPSLSEGQAEPNQQGLQRLYLNAHKVIFSAALPVVVLGCACAQPIVEIWAGSAYVGVGPVMQWLLLESLSLAIEYPSELLLYAQGLVSRAARITTGQSIANVAVSFLLVARYGAVGLAAGSAITHLIINVCWYTPTACRAAGISTAVLVKTVFNGLAWPSLLLIAEVLVMRLFWSSLPPLGLLILGILSGIAYLVFWSVWNIPPVKRLQVTEPTCRY